MKPRTSAIILTLLLLATLPLALLPVAAQPTPEQQATEIEECVSRCSIDTEVFLNCAIRDSGSVMCWGRGDGNVLGGDPQPYGENGMGYSQPEAYIEMPGDEVAVSIAVGTGHACAILSGGETACWGGNDHGQLGNNQTTTRSTEFGENSGTSGPVYVDFPEGRTATEITAGQDHSCAIMDNGSAMCWGFNFEGELGVGWMGRWAEGDRPEECDDSEQMDQYDCEDHESVPLPTPVATPDGRTVTSIAASADRTCLTLDNGSMMCATGHWVSGGLSYMSSVAYPDGFLLPEDASATSVSVSLESTCILVEGGDVYCWGRVAFDGNFQHTSESGKVSLPNGTSALEISIGGDNACAMLNTLQAICWGNNEPLEEIAVPEGRVVTSIAAGHDHNCVILDNGSAMCWGENRHGQLGVGEFGEDGGVGSSSSLEYVAGSFLWQNCDYDGDEVPDSMDSFPTNAWEWSDTDGDGVGDNADDDDDGDGEPDASDWAPPAPSETSDSDSDGVGDNADILPNDPSQSTDSDGDGYGDNVDGTDGDAFPWDSTEWADADGDDWGDNADQYPNDPYNGEKPEGEGIPGFGFMATISAMLLVAVFRSRRD